MNQDLTEELHNRFSKGDLGYIDSMLIQKDEKLVCERYYEHDYASINERRDPGYRYYNAELYPYYKGTGLHTMQSVTKSVTSLTVGIAIENGDFPDLESKMVDQLPEGEIGNLDPRKREITIEHLLTMTPGFDWDESAVPYDHPKNDCRRMEESHD